MAIAVLQDLPGVTAEQYDQVVMQLGLGNKSPQGNLVHIAGPTEGGWRMVDVWESEEALNAFLAVLGPISQSAGFAPPHVTSWPVHNMLTPLGYGIGG
jgi:hypothetical protein